MSGAAVPTFAQTGQHAPASLPGDPQREECDSFWGPGVSSVQGGEKQILRFAQDDRGQGDMMEQDDLIVAGRDT